MDENIKNKGSDAVNGYTENIEKNLAFYFGDSIGTVYSFGKDILFDVGYENLFATIESLKNNADFNFNILSSIKYKEANNFLLISLFSLEKLFTLNIRVKNTAPYLKFDYKQIINSLKRIFETSEYFSDRDYLKDLNNDLVIYSQIPETLDTFDIHVSLESDLIKNVYLCDEISRYNSVIVFKTYEINKLISMLNNLDYKAGVYPELCFCLGIENLLQIKIPKRAIYIRMLLCELFRISSHLSYIVSMSLVLGNVSAFNYILTEREKVLNIIELISGSRVIPNFIRIGGVKKDIDEIILDSIYKMIPQFYKGIKRVEEIFSSDVILLEKLKNKAVVNKRTAILSGMTGPNLRASAVRYDFRKIAHYLLYEDISFTIPLGRCGDNFDRVLIRFKEIYQSLKIINGLTKSMPFGAVGKMINPANLDLIASEIISTVECPHGIFKLFIEIKENKDMEIIPISPTGNNIQGCEKSVVGCSFDELLPAVSSFGIESAQMY
ncbi:MAG: hypothetical protein M1409_10695 [Actinobacteria bacterium]|nr:hypothetical protein [Actinomycetota bacterium]